MLCAPITLGPHLRRAHVLASFPHPNPARPPPQKSFDHFVEKIISRVDKTVIGLFDELPTLLNTLGAYKQAGKDTDTPLLMGMKDGAPLSASTLSRGTK